MQVKFTRTGIRRYAVQARRADYETVEMDPAPGYDDLLPHDLVHFVVEEELGLVLGVFGQLARGGDAGTFRLAAEVKVSRERTRAQRRSKKRGERLAREGRHDADLSERAAAFCHHEWLARAATAGLCHRAVARSPYVQSLRESSSEAERAILSKVTVQRICERLDRLSAQWSRLRVGQSLVLAWASSEEVSPNKEMCNARGMADSRTPPNLRNAADNEFRCVQFRASHPSSLLRCRNLRHV